MKKVKAVGVDAGVFCVSEGAGIVKEIKPVFGLGTFLEGDVNLGEKVIAADGADRLSQVSADAGTGTQELFCKDIFIPFHKMPVKADDANGETFAFLIGDTVFHDGILRTVMIQCTPRNKQMSRD